MLRLPPDVPYVCQFASAELADDLLSGTRSLADDPGWTRSGAPSVEEYARWARTWCGMACAKSALLAAGAEQGELSLHELATRTADAGGYVREGVKYRGLFYFPFSDMVNSWEGPLRAEPRAELSLREVVDTTRAGGAVMASVATTIRGGRRKGRRGGHLVLVLPAAPDQRGLRFHDPAGRPGRSQEGVTMRTARFGRYFAERGVILHPRS